MHAPPQYFPGGQPSPVCSYGYRHSSDSPFGMEGQTPGYRRQQAAFLGAGCASSNISYSVCPDCMPTVQGNPSKIIPSQAEQLACLRQLMYAQQQQQLILHQQNLLLPTSNSNSMMQPPPCCPGQVAHAPATQNQQTMRTGPMCQLSRQAFPQQVLAPHHPQGAPGAVCFTQAGNEMYMRNCMPQLPTGQHQACHQNRLWPGQSNGEVSPFPGGAQSPAAHHPVVCQALPNPHLHQTMTPTNAYQNSESPPRRHMEPSYSQEPQITLQVIPGIPGNSEDATDVQATASSEGSSAPGSSESKDSKTSSGIRTCGPRVSFSAQSPESTDSESELPTLAKQSVEQGPTEASATDCSSPRRNGKNVPSHSLDDLFEEDDGIANSQQGPKPVVRSAPSRKGSRPQILTLRSSVAYVANDNDCMICQRGREGSISRAPLDPSLFATEEEDQEARERRQREADDEKAMRQTQSAGHARRGIFGRRNKKSPRKAWSSVGQWGGRETSDLERVIEDCLALGYTRQQVLEQRSSLFTTEEIHPRMPSPKAHHHHVFRSRASM